MSNRIVGPLSFDGHGVNDRGAEYAPRVAMLARDYKNAEVGNLLSAAPELLEALEEITGNGSPGTNEYGDPDWTILESARQRARAALAKARGTS